MSNFLCVVQNQFIYRQRCFKNPLNVFAFKNHVYELKNSEKYYAVKNNKMKAHCRKWNPETRSAIDFDVTKFINDYIDEM